MADRLPETTPRMRRHIDLDDLYGDTLARERNEALDGGATA